jgi:asparagine synthase (glutamine-hydrolysing)
MVPYYFMYGYAPAPDTLYQRVSQLDPGTTVAVSLDGTVRPRTYWQLRFPEVSRRSEVVSDRRAATSHVRSLVTTAVERRLMSDVPLGAFLSGGLDSTIVVGLMANLTGQPVKTFSIGFEGNEAYDETAYARTVATHFRTDHTEFIVEPSALELVDRLLWHHDGPFGDSSAFPTYLVSRLTRQHVTVVLTGDGGDELFAGYLRFRAALLAEWLPRQTGAVLSQLLARISPAPNERHWTARARRFVRHMNRPLLDRLTGWNSYFFEDLDRLLTPEFRHAHSSIDPLQYLNRYIDELERLSPLNRLLLANFRAYLPSDLLVKTDRMTMAVSLEARAPFLDRDLMEYAATLPDGWKLSPSGRTKAILRDAFTDLVPERIRRRGKMGFGVPLDAWFRGELRSYVRDTLLAPSARCHAYLSRDQLESIVRAHESRERNAGHQIWCLLAFERWLCLLTEWRQQARAAPAPVASA